jgi:hypothetical protein
VNEEIYTGLGQCIKARSPFADTIVTAPGIGSAGSGYIPTEEAFKARSSTRRLARVSAARAPRVTTIRMFCLSRG